MKPREKPSFRPTKEEGHSDRDRAKKEKEETGKRTVIGETHSDTVIRAVTKDGGFRVIAIDMTKTLQSALPAQNLDDPCTFLAKTYAQLLMATVLLREAMAPELRLQAILQSDDPKTRLVADALPDGLTRGLVQKPHDSEAHHQEGFSISKNGLLQIQRTLHNGEIHEGVIAIPESGDVSESFMEYTQKSEQIVTMISVGCLANEGRLVRAGGYLIQLLPELERQKLMVMTQRLEDFEDIHSLLNRDKASPKELIDETLYGMEYEQVAERKVFFGCTCSQTRLAASLASLPKADIEALVEEKNMLEIRCDFCGKEYKFHSEQLRGMMSTN